MRKIHAKGMEALNNPLIHIYRYVTISINHGRAVLTGGKARDNGSNGSLSRKVQKLGASSLIVTLPRNWARRHNVNVGDMVRIYDEGDRLIIAPSGGDLKDRLHVNLSRSTCHKHVGRLVLCSYVFGYDEVIGESNRIIKGALLDRIAKTSSYLHGADVRLTNNSKVLEIEFEEDHEDPITLVAMHGKAMSRMLGAMSRFLREGEVSREAIRKETVELIKINYRMLRLLNKQKPFNSREEKRIRQLLSAGALLGIAGDAVSKLTDLIFTMAVELRDDERERLSFILEVAEIATATLASSLQSMSVKKAEDAYWKIKTILDLEENSHELVAEATPQYAYLLSRIIEVARLLEVAENVFICMALEEKHLNS